MPKIRCRCGDILSYGEIPCKLEYLFIHDVEYDAYDSNIERQELYMKMKSFLECPQCGRIWVFWNGFQSYPTEYVKVDE